MPEAEPRIPFDADTYLGDVQQRPCFICRIAAGEHEQENIVYRNDRHIAFFPTYFLLAGKLLVAPVDHREDVVGDFSVEEYLETQSFLYRAAKAVTAVVPTERLYLLSLGSNQGNAHVHWHIDPLPPGVPLEKQQLRALLAETHGFLDVRLETRRAWRDAIAAKLEEGADWEQLS